MSWKVSSATEVSPRKMLSVTSMRSAEGSRPVSASVRSTWATTPGSRNSFTEKLTLIVNGPVEKRSRCHFTAWRQASARIHWPMLMISPVSSASGMKSSGWIMPRVGCCQRTSASKPTIAPLCRSISGW